MQTQFVVEAKLYGSEGILPGAEEFLRRFDVYASGRTTIFDLPDERTWREALTLLERHGLKSESFYSFQLDPAELGTYPAVYFGVEVVEGLLTARGVDEAQLGANDIAKDYESERIILTARAKGVLEGSSRGLRWAGAGGAGGRELWRVEVAERLPEPLVVPAPVYVGPNAEPPGTYAVWSDGRDIITEENVNKLREAGLAVSEEVRAGSETVRWRPRLVASGALIHALQTAGVKGLNDPLTPLLTESHPLAR